MRFNLTGETYLPDMIRYFPEAPKTTFAEAIAASIFYNIIPLVVSFSTYFFIYFGIHKLFGRKTTLSLIVAGFVLTLTIPLVYTLSGGYEPLKYRASILAWVLCFVISILTYYWFNKKDGNNISSLA